ncbi:MAG: gluconate transporter [Saprospiraceae bacterium]|nr:gluconate transporter [Saprospiraceae bacterium]
MEINLLLAVLSGIAVLLTLILYFRIPAFIALLIASMFSGFLAGLNGPEVIATVQEGMASTLGVVATIVGLGAMFGAILERSGGAMAVAGFLTRKLGENRAPLSLVMTGFIVAIPVFFDVAFIILIPLVYAFQKRSKRSILYYAIPLLAGLAITHAFIPPTPGPVAVAEILGADLGWVIAIGLLAGIPTALVSGLLFGKYIARKIYVSSPDLTEHATVDESTLPGVGAIFSIIGVPIVLILFGTLVKSGMIPISDAAMLEWIQWIGHPFTALILANLLAWYILGIRRGFSATELLAVTSKSMAPAGTIILLTGAGGVFKQVLVNTGAGTMLAESLTGIGMPMLLFAFVAAALIRMIQGSATVAMITASGLVAPLLANTDLSGAQLGCLVISIASGASILSHVNDSGFWLVKQYLGMTEKQTLQSWTLMTTILACTGFVMACVLWTVVRFAKV